MRIRRRRTPLILLPLLLPQLAASLSAPDAAPAKGKPGSVEQLANSPDPAGPAPLVTSPKSDPGTADAPVDGLDGKPKLGPFVDGSSAGKKKPPTVEDIGADTKQSTPSKESEAALREAGASEKDREQHRMLMEAQANIMDDPNRIAPKEGTTGTEGGISEKERLKKAQDAKSAKPELKTPETPKEAPPLPESDDEPRIGKDKAKKITDEDDKVPGAPGMEVPKDLPDHDKLHDNPPPVPPSAEKGKPFSEPPSESVEGTSSTSEATPLDSDSDSEGLIQPFHSFVLSLTMILFSEIGDKTFLVAALMAMRHPRGLVFTAAFSALIAMTVLSAVLGHTLPALLPKRLTSFAAAALFLIFGIRLLREGWQMSPDEGVGEEMKEVEEELNEKEHTMRRKSRRASSITDYALEAGRSRRSRSDAKFKDFPRSPSSSPSRSPSPSGFAGAMVGLNNLLGLLLSPAWVQTFVMTFLGEWGDRSQIATIAMAAGQDYWWVTGGAIFGHACCTGVAVVGGRAIAGRVSMRVVTLGGAYAFVVFGIIYFVEAFYAG